ncbi:hypothetical protein [Streptomyces sp. NPDC091268]|uniref:hypothetical protein n=1 Tax=Streptomyces sp. NPDC091268 TaxID=3365979 RepID=UPI00382419F1
MISEPELEGGPPPDPAAAPERAAERDGERGPARPWLWALGGAVLASAVWAGAWVVQDRYAGAGPPIAYRTSEDLCADAPMKAVGTLAGGFEGGGLPRHAESPALDWSSCSLGTRWVEGKLGYQTRMVVEAHHRTDPEPEFGQGPGADTDLHVAYGPAELVPGLGQRAQITTYTGACRIQVLDGGVVFSLSVAWFGEEGAADPDVDALKAALIADATELMDRLHT